MKPECSTKTKLLQVALQLIWENSYGSVSVDDICRQAEVKKGSFYYFFPSKADLTIAALEAHWEGLRAGMDEAFSPDRPPLARIEAYCDSTLRRQEAKRSEFGKVCGCPLVTLGAELSTQDEKIRLKTAELIDRYAAYFETAVRDAGRTDDPRTVAEALVAFSQGLLLQAKIRNDLSCLAGLKPGMFLLLQDATTTIHSNV